MIFKNFTFRIWFIVSCAIIVLMLVVNILALGVFPDLLSLFLGRKRPIYAEGIVSMYVGESTSKEDARAIANAKTVETCEEGYVLLKNDDEALPIDKGSTIHVFGKNSVNLSYGGSGSGGFVGVEYKTIDDSLKDAGFITDDALRGFYEDDSRSGDKRAPNSSDLDSGGNQKIAVSETPMNKYPQDLLEDLSAATDDHAVVVITRIGGEGFDLPRYQGDTDGAVAPDAHYLELDKNELEMLEYVCGVGFASVTVVLNTPSAMEATFLKSAEYASFADKIDAAIWMGFSGGEGVMALGRIIAGDINPSGHTVDTWAADFTKDPSFVNFGTGPSPEYSDAYDFGNDSEYYFVDYEESIYAGYRYYETRGVTDGEEWYNDNVVYPFGHGLSYTDFTWTADFGSLKDATIDGKTKYTVTVTVHNDGDVAGKDVVQLYGHAPYTAGGVEKSEVVLLDFAKTELIEPGEDAEVTLTFDPYLLASYDYSGANDIEGTGYELDGGDGYALYVAENAHDRSRSVSFSVPSSGIKYDKDPVTGNPVVNRYTGRDGVTDSDAHLGSILSRNAWEETWPAAPSDDDRKGSAELLAEIASAAHNNPNDYESEAYPVFGAEVTVKLRDLLPEETPEASYDPIVPYNDERWDSILGACDPNDLIALFNYGAYQTRDVLNIGLPETISSDGPSGFTCFMDRDNVTGTCHYCSEPVMASTWNVDLIREIGNCMGEEGMWGSPISGTPYSAIYAPGANIHRSQFGGRCSEYFSEDPVISGKMSAAIIKGCQERGVACTIKHFVANEQETHRSNGGNSTWLTEQALRELYLKPFEIAVKESGSRALMSSFNRIGTKWTGGDYRLLTEILREEWGFRGYVICDFNTCPDYMFSKQMAYAGGDINLSTTPVDWCNQSSTSDMVVLRRCAKNLMYALVNSNAMNGEVIGYKMPIWQILVIVADCVIVAGLSVWGFFAIRKALKAPDKTPDEAGGESKQ